MTQRSMPAGENPTVVIRVGRDVEVEGWESERVAADTDNHSGLKVGRRSEAEVGRVRAKVGDHVLLDVGFGLPGGKKQDLDENAIQVQMGAGGKVRVPLGSTVKVYAGRSVTLRNVQGPVSVYAGRDVQLRQVKLLAHASAGRSMDLECEAVSGDEVKFTAGRDLRCHIRDLSDARLMIHDMGDRWETVFGEGRTRIRLHAGGDVTLVTHQEVVGQPPDYVVGNVEKPPAEPKTEPPPAE
jgi:hypothetical protein